MKHPLPVALLAIYLALMLALGIEPYDRSIWWAENLPVMIVVAILVVTYPQFRFSNTAYFLMWFFVCICTIGGHYTFARVPFETGNQLLAMTSLDFIFPDGRNNYDRFAHFLVGAFGFPVAELAYRKGWVSNIAVAVTLGIFALGFWAALYEVIEIDRDVLCHCLWRGTGCGFSRFPGRYPGRAKGYAAGYFGSGNIDSVIRINLV